MPFSPLGYGVQVIYGVGDYALASKLAADIKAVSGGRISPIVASSVTAAAWRSRSASGRGS
jgi:hypothetical protein